MYDYNPYTNDYDIFGAIDPAFDSVLPTLVGVYAIILCVALLVGLAYYIMNGIALFRMAKRTGVKHGWLGFIPLADSWLLGRISDVGSDRRHSGGRLLLFRAATSCNALVYTAFIISVFARLFAAGIFDGEISDDALLTAITPSMIATVIFALIMMALALCTTVFTCMAYYRIAGNFGGTGGSGFGVALILTLFFCPLATYILLLVLSGRTPRSTEGVPTDTPQSKDAPTDSVFQ